MIPDLDDVRASLQEEVLELARDVARAGGCLLVVGGWLRDALRGAPSKDLDLEVHGLAPDRVTALLGPRGFTPPVGRHFAVWRNNALGLDVSLPRGLSATTSADAPARGSDGSSEAIEGALRGRDLTVNAMAWDPLSGRLFDPLGGRTDLAAGRLRAADPERFGEDPLRVLRVARLSAALDARIDAELAALCRQVDLSGLPVERLTGELQRMLSLRERPWRAIEALRTLGRLDVFPPIAALEGVPQDPAWHPEGDVYLHTGLVVDRAATLAAGLEAGRAEILLWAALCHDLGKPATTRIDPDGRTRSFGHEVRGAAITRDWLTGLRVGAGLRDAVVALVRHHLAPALFVAQKAGPRAYRRLARRLSAVGLGMTDLERLARADHLGRTTPDARAGRFAAGDAFLAAARAARVEHGVRADVVRAADWMRSGVPAGPALGRLLARSREVQDETGWEDAERIMARVRRLEPAAARGEDRGRRSPDQAD